MSLLVDPTQRTLDLALGGLSTRQSLIASDLANIDTPGYQPKAVDFESALRDELAGLAGIATPAAGPTPPVAGPSADVAMRATDPRHFAAIDSVAPGLQVQPAVG